MVNNIETIFGLTPVTEQEVGCGVQYRFVFDNDYHVYVVRNKFTPNFEKGYWHADLVVIGENGFIEEVNFYYKGAARITHLLYNDVITLLSQVEKYPPVWRRDPKEAEVEWLPDNYGVKSVAWV